MTNPADSLDPILDAVLDCVTTTSPLAFDELALTRAVAAALASGDRATAVTALAEAALVVGRCSRDAARALYRAIDHAARAADARDAAARAHPESRRAPLLGSAAPAGTIKVAALLGGRRRP